MTGPADISHLILLGLAVARLTSLIVQDDIVEPLRHRLFTWSPPIDDPDLGRWYQSLDMQSGTSVSLRPAGFLGRLVSCYHCTAVWCSAIAALSVAMIPAFAWPVLSVAAVAQIAELVIRQARGE